jgi:hypothetical protein
VQRIEVSRLIVITFTFNHLVGELTKVGILKKIVGIRDILGKARHVAGQRSQGDRLTFSL